MIEIKPEDINKYIADQITKSVIGDKLKEQIEKAISNITSSYNNPIESIIRDYMASSIKNLIAEKYKEAIEEKLKEVLTGEVLTQLAEKIIERIRYS